MKYVIAATTKQYYTSGTPQRGALRSQFVVQKTVEAADKTAAMSLCKKEYPAKRHYGHKVMTQEEADRLNGDRKAWGHNPLS